MYVDRSLHGYKKKEKLIDELNFKNGMLLKRKTTSKFFVDIKYKKRDFSIHPECFDAKNIFSHPFIHNLKHKPNMVQDLSKQMMISLKKQILENIPEQLSNCITNRNVKIEYRGRINVKKEIVLQPG